MMGVPKETDLASQKPEGEKRAGVGRIVGDLAGMGFKKEKVALKIKRVERA